MIQKISAFHWQKNIPNERENLMSHFKSILLLSFAVSACGSGGNSKSTPAPLVNPPSQTELGGKDESGAQMFQANKWLSDVRDAEATPCTGRQIFANETCFAEIHFSEDTMELRRPEGTFPVFDRNKPISPELLKLYRLSSPQTRETTKWDTTAILVNEGVRALRLKTFGAFFHGYVFLPEEITLTQKEGEDLNLQKVIRASFPLHFTFGIDETGNSARIWDAEGTAKLCDTEFKLPIVQRDLEKACGFKIGTSNTVYINGKTEGSIKLSFGFAEREFDARTVEKVSYEFARTGVEGGVP